jgi:hypothetical protein
MSFERDIASNRERLHTTRSVDEFHDFLSALAQAGQPQQRRRRG